MYKKMVLDNGVRVVMEKMTSLKSVAIGVWTKVGSRDEDVGEEGFSHFVEHMMFKGTRKRTASQISHEIDTLGGEMNAFTTHEVTVFYVKVLDQQISQATELLSDLFGHSRFPSKEIEKEKQVVLEEIRTVKDDPEDFVHELHAKDVLGSHPLGRSILGERRSMESLRRPDLLRYRYAHYHPHKTVISVAGNVDQPRLIQLLNKNFGGWTGEKNEKGLAQVSPWPEKPYRKKHIHTKKLEQVHLCLGFKGLPVGHPDRYAANILNTILGGGVSSRLFQEIRENRGLAYTIYSHLSSFSDGGNLTVYAATRPEEAESVVSQVCKVIQKLCKQGLNPKELERTKTQLKGNLMMGLEGTYGRMNKLAKDELFQERRVTLQEMLKEIDKITLDHVWSLSKQLFDFQGLAMTALGPIPQKAFPNWE